MCQDTALECKEPGLKSLSCVVPLYDGLVAGLDIGRLERSHCTVLELFGLKRGFLSLVRLERLLGG